VKALVSELTGSSREKWKILFLSFYCMFSFLVSMQAIPPILPQVMEEFNLGFASASNLMWLVALPGLFTSIIGGFLMSRCGVKIFLTSGTLITSTSSILSAVSHSFLTLQLSRLLLGIGGSLVVISAPALILEWFEREELGAAMGVFSLNMPVATVVAFNFLGALSSRVGWRTSIATTGVVNLLALALCLLYVKERVKLHPHKLDLTVFRNMDIWMLGAVWALFNMGAIGYTTWAKTMFMRYDKFSAATSDLLGSLLMMGAFTTPLTGLLSDRVGRRKPLIIASSFSMFLIFKAFLYAEKDYFIPLGIGLGLAAAFLPPPLFALPEEVLGAGRGGVGLGILNTFLNLGVILGPFIVGYVLDLTNSKFMGFLSMATFALSATVAASTLKTR